MVTVTINVSLMSYSNINYNILYFIFTLTWLNVSDASFWQGMTRTCTMAAVYVKIQLWTFCNFPRPTFMSEWKPISLATTGMSSFYIILHNDIYIYSIVVLCLSLLYKMYNVYGWPCTYNNTSMNKMIYLSCYHLL